MIDQPGVIGECIVEFACASQVLGSHNSYHVIQPPEVMELLRLFSPELADSLEYSHLPLPEQFTDQGIRQIELDVFADREGGLYGDPAGPRLAQIPFVRRGLFRSLPGPLSGWTNTRDLRALPAQSFREWWKSR